MTTTSDQQQQPLPVETAGTDSTWEEIGFAEFPIVATSLKRPPLDTIEYVEPLGYNEKREPLTRTWQVVGSTEYGRPRLPDLDVFIAILVLLQRQSYTKKLVLCSVKDICDIVGLTAGGETYKRVRMAFIRFQTTSYIAKNVFTDPRTKQRVISEGWSIISDHRLIPDHVESSAGDGLPPSYFAVSAAFLNRLRTGQMKPVDLGLWRQLPLGLEKPIYHYLDKNLYGGKDRHEIGIKKFSERIGLTGKYDRSQLQRLYRKPLQNLVELGFLSEFKFERSKSSDDPVKVIVFPGPRARTQRRLTRALPIPERVAQPVSEPTPKTPPQGSAQDLVRLFHELAHGAIPQTLSKSEVGKAQQLLDIQGDQELARYTVEYACAQARLTGFAVQNFGAVFSNNYPDRARAQHQAEQEQLVRSRAQAEQARLEAEYHLWTNQELDKRWQALGPETQEVAIKAADSQLEEKIGRRGMSVMTPTARRNTAERLARSKLDSSLLSFEEWLAGHKPTTSPNQRASRPYTEA